MDRCLEAVTILFVRGVPGIIVVIAASLVTRSAFGGITVTSYRTEAATNAYAPFSRDEYFSQQDLLNLSPAVAEASGDWIGTNAGGSTNTWHYVGSSRGSTITTFSSSSFFATGDGSFTYELTTTAGFIDPRNSGGVFTPGGDANYWGRFSTDVPAVYSVSVELGRYSLITLSSSIGTIFDAFNVSTTPTPVSQTGMIPAGDYLIHTNTSLGAANLGTGTNDYVKSGGFTNFSFTVQTPEPCLPLCAVGVFLLGWRRGNALTPAQRAAGLRFAPDPRSLPRQHR